MNPEVNALMRGFRHVTGSLRCSAHRWTKAQGKAFSSYYVNNPGAHCQYLPKFHTALA
jgi:hypothetical protein